MIVLSKYHRGNQRTIMKHPLSDKIKKATKLAIKNYGQYTFDDKGVEEVLVIPRLIPLRQNSVLYPNQKKSKWLKI